MKVSDFVSFMFWSSFRALFDTNIAICKHCKDILWFCDGISYLLQYVTVCEDISTDSLLCLEDFCGLHRKGWTILSNPCMKPQVPHQVFQQQVASSTV